MSTIFSDFFFKKINLIGISFLLCFPLFSFSQTPNGPAGIQFTNGTGTLAQWYRADLGITLTGGLVSKWDDQSGNGNTLNSPAGSRPATVVDANLNNQTCVAYAGGQYFNSALTGPNVNALTIFLVARGTSYQSLFRWQNNAGIFVVYPWEFGGGRTFISSSDGGTGGGIASGLVNNENNIGVAMYVKNTATTGMQTYINGALNAQRTSVNSVLPTQPFYSGRYNPGASEYPTCDVGEMIVYNTNLNNTQLWIVENYLAAKYNCTLTVNSYYTMNTVANGSYYHDVAGIGKTGGNAVNDARGTGIVEINNPSSLNNGDFYMWGDDNGTLGYYGTNDYPASLQGRLVRVWRGSMTNNVGTVDISFDLTGLGPVTASDLRLLLDKNNNGIFSDETVGGGGIISGATSLGGNVYQFSAVTLADKERFTLGTINSTQTPLPIQLLYFNASQNESEVNLNWATASEINNNYFTVERSANGTEWTNVAQVNGSGTSTTQKNYQAFDINPLNGTSYYRLKQTDFDGNYTYSNDVAVNFEEKTTAVSVYPNPFSDVFNISDFADNANHQIKIYNAQGKNIINVADFKNEKQIDLGSFPDGIYFIKFITGDKTQLVKIIKTN